MLINLSIIGRGSVDAFNALLDKLSGWLDAFVVMLPNVVAALLVMLGFGIGARFVQRVVTRVFGRISDNVAICNLLGSLARVATVVLGLFIALGLLQLDKTVTSLLAGVGVIGLALGFAFQDIAANLMSGVFMALRRPFAVGDMIEVDGACGIVDRIELRATTITTLSGLSQIIPNKDVFQNKILNFTKTCERRVELPVGVAYSDDLELAMDTAKRALAAVELRDESRDVAVYCTDFGDSSINLVAHFWLQKPDERSHLRARSDAIVRIKRAFDEAGLTIPFPIRTLDFGAGAVGGRRVDEMKLRVVEAAASRGSEGARAG